MPLTQMEIDTLHDRVPLDDLEKNFQPTTVAVTGGAGYVAGPVVRRLLRLGHKVHVTVRNKGNKASWAHLMTMPNAAENLRVFEADLRTKGSFGLAFEGCTCVMHVAAPFIFKCKKGEEDEKLIKPMMEGVKNVFDGVNQVETIKTVVMTSSMAAMFGDFRKPEHQNEVLDENCWNTDHSAQVLAYFYAKTISEKAAFEQEAKQSRWRLCTTLPGFVMGPPTSTRKDGESVKFVINCTKMRVLLFPFMPNIVFPYTDVRELAKLHVMCMCTPAAKGRYTIVSNVVPCSKYGAALRANYTFPKFVGGYISAPTYPMRFVLSILGPLLFGFDKLEVIHFWRAKFTVPCLRIANEFGMAPEKMVQVNDMIKDMGKVMKANGMFRMFG